jgi:hypothetical protein
MIGFLRQNAIALASLVAAGASLFVATLSLRYSVGAQQEDAFYKELSIKPALQIEADSQKFEIRFENVGLGPAQIERLVFSDGTHCLDTDTVQDWNAAHAFFDDFTNALRSYILAGLPAAIDNKRAPVPIPFVPAPSPGVVIKAGERFPVISFDINDINAYVTFLKKFQADAPDIVEQHFMRKGIELPLYIHYCSLSGRYCASTSGDDVLACTLKSPTKPDSTPGLQKSRRK